MADHVQYISLNDETLGIVSVLRLRGRDSQSWYRNSDFLSLGLRFGIIIGIKQVLVLVSAEQFWSRHCSFSLNLKDV